MPVLPLFLQNYQAEDSHLPNCPPLIFMNDSSCYQMITSTPRVRLLSDAFVCHFLINQPDRFYCLATHGSLSAAIDRRGS
ncbi:hypothetical protein TNCV_3104371 [Trichonephila clavipes]|nr:hypothetical protein TNCV_3104371 [Trichonephila clavipes]